MKADKLHNKGLTRNKRGTVASYSLDGSYTQGRGCLSKRTYATRKAAKKATIDYKRKRGKAITFYRCPFCGEYHLTRKRIDERSKDGRERSDGE